MIYLVSKQTFTYKSNLYNIISIEESLQILESIQVVGLDTETSGLDPYTNDLLLLQLGCKDFQVVIDTTTINPINYKQYLESDRLFLGWNLKFDLKWLYKYNIWPKNIYDGFLAEKLMWLGYPAGMHSMSLKTAGETYCNIELDKSIRGKIIWSKTLSDDIIEYAANDVKYLEDIKNAQEKLLKEKDLLLACKVENAFLFSIAYFEYCGVKLDIEKWKNKMKKDQEATQVALDSCNKWIIDFYQSHNGNNGFIEIVEDFLFRVSDYDLNREDSYTPKGNFTILEPLQKRVKVGEDNHEYYEYHAKISTKHKFPYVFVETQGDLFSGFDTSPQCNINWNSAKQLIPIFKLFEINVEVEDKSKGGIKDSIDAKCLGPQKDKCSLIPIYLKYKETSKVTSTYGESFLKQINPVSGRIHTNLNQLGTDTGRLSSGGKDKEHNIEYLNIQNLPADSETRACFVAEPGNKWISIDYSGQETYLMASIAEDQAIIKELTEGSGDIHSLTAYMSYSEIPRNTPIKDIKKLYHNLRQDAKGIEFAINLLYL